MNKNIKYSFEVDILTERFKQSLIEAGRELFIQYSLQKTTIQDITQSVGVATGTFYNYFSSKEHLYFAVLEQEEKVMQQTLKDIPEIKGRNRREILHELLSKVVFDIQRNPFIQQLLDSDQLKRLTHKLPQAVLEDHFKRDEDTFVSVVQVWQKHGLINHQNPTKVASIIRALFVLTLHEYEIGKDYFETTIEWYIERIVDGLMKGV